MGDKPKYNFDAVDEIDKQSKSADPKYDFSSVDSVNDSSKYSPLESAAIGFQSGAQLGTTTELKGLGKALGSTEVGNKFLSVAGGPLTGFGAVDPEKLLEWYYTKGLPKSPEIQQIADSAQENKPSFDEAYRSGQQEAAAEDTQARKDNPWSYGGAKFAGGFVPGIAASPLAATAPLRTAAAAGAITGAGESKSNIEDNPVGLATDTAIGGATGAALQYGLGKLLGNKAPSAAKNIMERGEKIPQLEQAVQAGEQGLTYSAKPSAKSALDKPLKQGQEDIINQIIAPRDILGKKIEEATTGSSFKDVPSMDIQEKIQDVASTINENISALDRKTTGEIVNSLTEFRNGLLNPRQTYELKKKIGALIPELQDSKFQATLKSGVNALDQELSKINGYSSAMQNFTDYARHVPEALLAKGHDPDLANIWSGNLKDQGQLKIANEVQSLLGKLRMGGVEGTKAQSQLQNMVDSMKKLSPKQLDEIGINPDAFQQNFINLADKFAARAKATGEVVGSDIKARVPTGAIGGFIHAGEAGMLKGANMYGQLKRGVRNFVSSSPEEFANDAKILAEQGGNTGKALAEGLASKDILKRNGAVFSILQLPSIKKILGIGEEEK